MLKNMKIATWLMLMLLLLGLMPMGTGAIAFYFMQQNGNSIGRMSTFSDEEAALNRSWRALLQTQTLIDNMAFERMAQTDAADIRKGITEARNELRSAGIARNGETLMANAVDKMRAINDSARQVGDITSVIDGIAFQTNILALNAAVEAARAGEQGRGFAVVAGEVRNLAQRCATSAKEISSLVDGVTGDIAVGVRLVEQAGETMNAIVGSVNQVTSLMDNISYASEEQSKGIEQVGVAVTQMDQVTQQNAALVEEVATTAVGVEEQAALLAQAVAVFQLAEGETRQDEAQTSAAVAGWA